MKCERAFPWRHDNHVVSLPQFSTNTNLKWACNNYLRIFFPLCSLFFYPDKAAVKCLKKILYNLIKIIFVTLLKKLLDNATSTIMVSSASGQYNLNQARSGFPLISRKNMLSYRYIPYNNPYWPNLLGLDGWVIVLIFLARLWTSTGSKIGNNRQQSSYHAWLILEPYTHYCLCPWC